MTTMNTNSGNNTAQVKGLNVNYVNKTIECTEAFLKNAGKPNTEEFKAMALAMSTFPNFKVKRVTIKKNDKKVSYKDLSIERMLAFVHVFAPSKLEVFENHVETYLDEKTGKIEKGKYATLKKLFLDNFKDDYKKAIKDSSNVASLDKLAKELKKKAEGDLKKALTLKQEKESNVVEMNQPLKKAANE